jgi:hypothetical protein
MMRFASLGVVLLLPALAQAQNARITRVQTIHNVVQGGHRGMLIRVHADVNGLQGQKVNMAVFFYRNGQKLPARALAGRYRTFDGQVTTQQAVVPMFNNFNREGVDLFIPYFELTVGLPVILNLQYQVEVQNDNGLGNRALANSLLRSFTVDGLIPEIGWGG